MTNDIDQWRREHGVPSYVPYPGVEYTAAMAEPSQRIGAYDLDVIDMTNVTEWTPEEELPWYEAGALYAMARRGANEMRRRAYERW